MNLCLTDDQKLLQQSVREFAEAELRPHVMEWDEAQAYPRELLAKLAALGLMGIQFPEQYGGAAMSSVDYCICIEELARVDPSVCLSVAAHNGLGSAHIFMFGTEEQKQRYLVPLATGQMLAAWALTEASSGSDAAAMRTTRDERRRQLGDQRHEAVHHARCRWRHHGRDGGHEPCEGESRNLRVHRRARTPGTARREEGRQTRDAGQRDERGHLRELSSARVADARRGRAGLHQRAPGARRRSHRHRGARRGAGARRV